MRVVALALCLTLPPAWASAQTPPPAVASPAPVAPPESAPSPAGTPAQAPAVSAQAIEAPAATAGAPSPAGLPGPPGAAVAAPAVGPVPTADAAPAASDHDAVVGHVGLDVRRIDASPFGLDLRPVTGCPATQTTPCRVTLGALSLRYWQSRNLALLGGLALGFGGGRDGSRALDSYVGFGPVVGMALLLGNWRHLAVAASPEASFVWFKPGGDSTTSAKIVTLRAAIEGELHFGFVGVPALSIGMAAGLGFRYVSVADARVWSIGVIGPGAVSDVLSDLFVRYYL